MVPSPLSADLPDVSEPVDSLQTSGSTHVSMCSLLIIRFVPVTFSPPDWSGLGRLSLGAFLQCQEGALSQPCLLLIKPEESEEVGPIPTQMFHYANAWSLLPTV